MDIGGYTRQASRPLQLKVLRWPSEQLKSLQTPSLFRGFQKVRNVGSRRSAVRAEPIKEHETVDMKLEHSFSKVRACIDLEFE